ncbi:putative photosynthetic complex assembly protein PuhE [Rhodomicrobium sp.]|uniref:putative photosynthetic complex assembly protein PuhE n=1 Tax=Rhodomicrobium sp. TaxID=2720632 RepID=UPI0039E2C3D4
MIHYGLPTLYVLFVWWFSTGAVLYLNNLPKHTYKWSVLGGTLVLLGSLYGLYVSSQSQTVLAAYVSFTCGLLAWAWTQLTFYTGVITGPRKTACPPGCSGSRHMWHAAETCLYHEASAALLGVAVCFATLNGTNHIGSWTYTVIWLMHASAKVNAVLGVRNLNDHFFPEHLRYLSSYLRKKPMNLLFPVSITVSTVFAAVLVHKAVEMQHSPFDALALTFSIVILALGIIEHWFLVLPIPAEALWNWSVRAKTGVVKQESVRLPEIVDATKPASTRLRIVASRGDI